jgi:Protein ENHANCED DISEASE RESISTANCE 2, C-terminal
VLTLTVHTVFLHLMYMLLLKQPQERCGDGSLPADDFRNERFKLIPNICEGPFIIRRAVGNKVLLLVHVQHHHSVLACIIPVAAAARHT